jgi:hypothetical protein
VHEGSWTTLLEAVAQPDVVGEHLGVELGVDPRLVEALIEHGNALADPPPDGGVFSPGQGGWVAYLRGRIDWDWVQEAFELPDLVRYDPTQDEIFDHKHWISILGSNT